MKNPCYKSKREQCTNRFVGCRETCDKWKLYDQEKRKEYSDRRLNAISLPNTKKEEFKTKRLQKKAGH